MGRLPRAAEAGMVYQVLNRANARMRIVDQEGDYAAFEKVWVEAHERVALRTCIARGRPRREKRPGRRRREGS